MGISPGDGDAHSSGVLGWAKRELIPGMRLRVVDSRGEVKKRAESAVFGGRHPKPLRTPDLCAGAILSRFFRGGGWRGP